MKFLINGLNPVVSATDSHMKIATVILALLHHLLQGPELPWDPRWGNAFLDILGFTSGAPKELGRVTGVDFKEHVQPEDTKLAAGLLYISYSHCQIELHLY